jgi:hypothetical protein
MNIILTTILMYIVISFVSANDGVGGMSAGGLYVDFDSSTKVSIESELLEISEFEIKVHYQFKNNTKKDERHLVVFPLPSYGCADDNGRIVNDFETIINNQKIKYNTEEKIYNNKKKDITKEVLGFYGSVGCRNHTFETHVKESIKYNVKDPDKYKFSRKYEAHGTFYSNDKDLLDKYLKGMELGIVAENDGENLEFPWGPSWKIKRKHYFNNTFPAGEIVNVSHRYTPSLGISVGMPKINANVDQPIWTDYTK